MNTDIRKKLLEKQGYRMVGNHSAIKTCLWCKRSIRGGDTCYKHKFYGIRSWRCIQASVSLDMCNQKCLWCWRDVENENRKETKFDKPSDIIDGFVRQQKKALEGFHGYDKVNRKRINEAGDPKHIALSLTGETTMYPYLPEMVEEIRRRNMTSFIVSNGTIPSMTRKLVKAKPIQFYITLPAPDEKTYKDVCSPSSDRQWEDMMKTLDMLGKFERGTIRMTLVRDINMIKPESYAKLLKDTDFKFLELKSAMSVGYAKHRIDYKQMPRHHEIKKFAEKIAKEANLKIIDEKEDSRVVLLMREDSKDRMLKFED